MACDNTKKSVGAFERLARAWDAKVDGAFDKALEVAQKYDKKGRLIPTKMQQDLADMLNGFRAARNDIHRMGKAIKEFLDTLEEGESAKLVQALNADIDPATLSGTTAQTYKRFRAIIDHNAQRLVDLGLLEEKSMIKDYVKRYYENYLETQTKVQQFLNDRKMKRKDLSHEDRIALGMIEDASYVVPRTIVEQRIQLLKGEFLQKIADVFGEDAPIEDGYVKIPTNEMGGGVKKYGALSGKWVPESIKKMLDEVHMAREEIGIAEKYLFPVVDHLKVNLTVKNPVTHIYNVLSNIQVAALQGNLANTGRILKMMRDDPTGFKALLAEVEPFGLDSMLADMETPQVFSDNRGVNVAMSLLQNLYMAQNSKVGKVVRRAYDWEDKVFKIAAYDGAKRKAEAAAGRSLTDAEKLAVFKEATAPYANYSTPLPGVFKLLDKSGVSPFLHYLYKATPAVAKMIAKNPMKYAALQIAMLEIGAHVSQDDDVLKPEWAGTSGKYNLFFAKDWAPIGDSDWYWNAGRMMPGAKIGAIDLQGGFIGGALRIVSGETPLGFNIGSQYDSTLEKFWKRSLALAENYAPPLTFGRYGQRAAKKLAGEEMQNYYKEDMGWDEFGLRAAGVRHFNQDKEVQSKIRKAQNELKYKTKKEPENKDKHDAAYRKTMEAIRDQAKTIGKRVDTSKPAASSRGGKPIGPVMPKKMIDLGF